MRISKKNFLTLLEQNLQEMPMNFPNSVKYKVKNPNFNPHQDPNDPTPNDEYLPDDAEKNFTDRPHPDVERNLRTQNTPLKKVPMPAGQGNQNFPEMLASETYADLIRRVKAATHHRGRGDLNTMMFEALQIIDNVETQHRPELERLAAETVFKLYKIPEGQMNIHAKLISYRDHGDIERGDFLQPQQDDTNPEAPDVDEVPQNVDPEDVTNQQPVEDDYVDKLENFDLERAKRRLLNAMTQGAAHSAYTMYAYFKKEIRQLIGPLPNNADIMDLYALMMSVNDTNYWSFSDGMMKQLQGSVAGKAEVKFPQSNDGGEDEGEDGGEEEGEEGEEGESVDSLGQPIDPQIPQIYVTGINFPVLFHEVIKGVQKVIAAAGMTFPGYDETNPRHHDFMKKVMEYEDVLEYELWDLRLGPAIWNRFLRAHPGHVVDPEQQIELQHFVQMYIYKLPPRKFLALMKEIMSGSDRAKTIVATLVRAIEELLAQQDYEDTMAQYEDEIEDIDSETTDDELTNLLSGIPGIRLSDDDDEDDEDDGGELIPSR